MLSVFSALDHAHMARALRLAGRGLFTTQPNPRVGCVLARGEEVVGEGWHERAGEPHAEAHALRAAGARARGATAYVTLEPCAHHGRTPPCADALVEAGVARVVIAAEDPNPRVDGRGVERLRAAGIAVASGLMRDAAREINRGFFCRLERGRPWLRIKLATSLDGRTALANGESKWITGEAARADVQRWRARSSAILTGSGTVLADDPHLTVRLAALVPLSPAGRGQGEGGGRGASADSTDTAREAAFAVTFPHPSPLPGGDREASATMAFAPPLRVVLDRTLRTPASAHVLDASAPALLLHAPDAVRPARLAAVECAPVATRDGRLDLDAALRLLAAREVNEVQVEAGPTLAGALFAAGLVDELLLYVAPVLLGDLARPLLHLPPLAEMAGRKSLRVVDQRMVGTDIRLLLRPM
ncbi:MAG: bifunctional diaminohydroxyphosphoribosylaminopyrimidine deaminase/5-amino-6-(5-phosphoribosylamino)uracil reductase RibD [Mizugakiibacter sp.]|uniref:bifunctional diaminohydroxyphosphoribosylaminopyrimidine deaminase/5-amino-6-(5-phosphoribosylamino)uracil reductase RibD n=1 Tax=Mizugakiibacter sp. TaxID=1972610 RepID=UPI0031C586DB|nr:bifunctional diaminohydroxyphosphoribosylaminopyrimidine deaminase/5-amino-6-(5-phosphoribosylamino)uracil reductase RibD [Xanthomonadaceae bacterium]